MKIRWMGLLLLVLALAGCMEKDVQLPSSGAVPTVPTETRETVQTVPVTELEETLPTGPEEGDFVRVLQFIPEAEQELLYATDRNFTGQRIYEFEDAYLRYGTVKKLMTVAEELAEQGLFLKIWDGFRPVSAQFRLWEACPDPAYVSNPETGFSSHSRGNTVDLTLVDRAGAELVMPTGFDDFSDKADRDYSDCTGEEQENALLLQTVMEKHGFKGYAGEWWHFSDTESYPVEETFLPVTEVWCYADCREFISLRKKTDVSAECLRKIPAGEQFKITALYGDFVLAEYEGQYGYVLRSYTAPVEEKKIWAANCQEYISFRNAPDGEVITTIPKLGEMELLGWEGRYAHVIYEGQAGYVLSSYIRPKEVKLPENLEITANYSYGQMLADLEMLAETYSEAEWTSAGTSELGREIPVLRIGDENAEYHVLVQGAIHGREHMTAWLLVAMAADWLEKGITADVCWHILPMVNPDGVTISQCGIQNQAQRILYQSDVENGYTSAAEVSYASQWKANGLGVDINRNFPAGWELIEDRESLSAQKYRGESPFSSAEAKVLRDYTMKGDFDATISYHAYGSLIYYEYGKKQTVNRQSEELALAVRQATGYRLQSSSGIDGAGYKDWVIEELEIPSITVEIGCGPVPLEERECYSVYERNCLVLEAVTEWLKGSEA